MRSRRRVVLLAFLAALLAAVFAMPLLRGLKCQKAGGIWDRDSLTCHPAPAAPASPRG
jgi:hypothetical protein